MAWTRRWALVPENPKELMAAQARAVGEEGIKQWVAGGSCNRVVVRSGQLGLGWEM